MANNFDSNITVKLAKVFLEKFESARVLSKNVNTQLLTGVFDPSSGDTVNFKRPTDYKSKRTSDGDVSGGPPSDIITGKAAGVVQDYFTVDVAFTNVDEALKMDKLDELLAPMAERIVTDLELDFGSFMMKNTALLSGAVGNPTVAWSDVANAGAVMQASGVPMDNMWSYAVNPFTQTALASDQRSLGAGGAAGGLISDTIRKATITENFAGFNRVMTATTLATYTTDTETDRVGSITGTPDVTYLTAKDTMTQSITVADFGADLVINAGETLTITGRNRLNLSTRQPVINASGGQVVFSGTVTTDVVLSGTGTGTIVITGPAIFETDGAYNTVDSVITAGDILTLQGDDSTIIQPNLFWHKQAFSIGSVSIPKLFSTDTIATTEDGLSIRVSKGADILSNKQIVRFDLLPAYAALNPFFAGQGYGID